MPSRITIIRKAKRQRQKARRRAHIITLKELPPIKQITFLKNQPESCILSVQSDLTSACEKQITYLKNQPESCILSVQSDLTSARDKHSGVVHATSSIVYHSDGTRCDFPPKFGDGGFCNCE